MAATVNGEYGFGIGDDKRLATLQSLGFGIGFDSNLQVNVKDALGNPWGTLIIIEVHKNGLLYASESTNTGSYNFYLDENDTYQIRTNKTHPLRYESVVFVGNSLVVDFVIFEQAVDYQIMADGFVVKQWSNTVTVLR